MSGFGAPPQGDGTYGMGNPMPTKFKVLLGMYLFSIVTSGIELYLDPGVLKGIGVGLTLFILVSLWRGNEAMRQFVMFFAFLGLCVSGVALILLGVASFAAPYAILAAALSAYSFVRSGFVLWCLRQQDVQRWMYNKSMKQDQLA